MGLRGKCRKCGRFVSHPRDWEWYCANCDEHYDFVSKDLFLPSSMNRLTAKNTRKLNLRRD